MVSFVRLSECLVTSRRSPIKLAAVDDNTAERRAVAADPFRGGVGNDVGAELNRVDKVSTHAECVVDDERKSVLVRHLCEPRDVGDATFRVRDALDIDRPRVLVDLFSVVLRLAITGDELDVDAKLLEENYGRISINAKNETKPLAYPSEGCTNHRKGGKMR
jgi:hypothetical protein